MKPRTLMTAAALTIAAATMSASAQDETTLIPRDVLFANPNMAAPRISPDGAKLSYLAPVDGALNVWVGPADDPWSAQPLTNEQGKGIRVYLWAFTNQHILYLRDETGDEDWRLYCVDVASGETRPLTPAQSTEAGRSHRLSARIKRVSHLFPGDIVMGLNNRDPRYHDLYVVNIDTGELVELYENEQHFQALYLDDNYSVRLASRRMEDGGVELLAQEDTGAWQTFTQIPMEDVYTTGPIEFDKTGEHVYMIDSRGRDTAALKSVDLETGAAKTLEKDRDADVMGGVLIHPVEKTVQAASTTYERREWHVLDNSVKGDFKYLEDVADGELSVISRTLDDMQWIVAYEMDDGPARYYRYDRRAETAHFLFTDRSQLEGLTLAQMHSDVIKTRDREKLVVYYTLPPWTDPRGKGRPQDRLPMVLWVHGGPWARTYWGYEPVHQWLANRGYAVLSVNYRGSMGFGKKLLEAGNREWGGRMHDDLIDAVEWAVSKKIADEQRVAIMGGSYGGYAALVGLTKTPEKFACGVNISGPSNLVTFLESVPQVQGVAASVWTRRVGDLRSEEGRAMLMERSPLSSIGQITKPLLIVHGSNDPRVEQAETEQIVEALQDKGVPVTYVVFPDEAHGISQPANRLSFYAVAETFLAEHLGGRFQEIGDAFADSSIQIPVGGNHLAGVTGTFGN